MKKSAIIMSVALMLGMFTPAIATENLVGPPEKQVITLELPKEKSKEQRTELPVAPAPANTNEDASEAADRHTHGGGVVIISGTTLLIILILLILLL